nr:PAS domain S-box protein [uncultured Methanoregula sp.]
MDDNATRERLSNLEAMVASLNELLTVQEHVVSMQSERLKENEEKYRAFFTTSKDCVFITSVDGRWIDFNDAAIDLFGYDSREDLLNVSIREIYADSADQEAHKQYIRKNGFSREYPVDLKKKNGTILNTLVTSVLRKDSRGNVIGFQGSIRDITEQKKIERRIAESERKYRTLAESSPDQIIIIGKDDTVQYVNTTGAELLHLPFDQILGKPRTRLFPPEIAVAQGISLKKVFETGTPLRQEESIRFGNVELWVDTSLVPLKDGEDNVNAVLCILHDITERKKAEETIRFSNMILSTQQETSPDGILVVDEHEKSLSYNRRFVELWGIPQDILDSHSDERALEVILEKLADSEGARAKIRHLYAHPYEKSHEEVLLKDGRVFERYSAPMMGANNHYYGRVWYFHDITERKLSEIALKESNDRFLMFIKEAAMRLKNPIEVVEENISTILDDIESGRFDRNDGALQLKLQIKNLEQIRQNIIELNKVIVGRSGDLSDASIEFLTE